MAKKNLNPFGNLADAFSQAEAGAAPGESYGLDADTLMPSPGRMKSGKPQTPAQHNAVIKAAKVSARKRKARTIAPQGF